MFLSLSLFITWGFENTVQIGEFTNYFHFCTCWKNWWGKLRALQILSFTGSCGHQKSSTDGHQVVMGFVLMTQS